jgi:hypothetical protein
VVVNERRCKATGIPILLQDQKIGVPQLMETIGSTKTRTPCSEYKNFQSFSMSIPKMGTCRRKNLRVMYPAENRVENGSYFAFSFC